MKKFYLLIFLLLPARFLWAQDKESINPTISPALFRYNDQITVTYDVTGTPLASLTNAYIWVWIPGKNTDAKYNVNPASTNTTLTNNAKFVKSESDGHTYFTIVFAPSDFFTTDISAETQIGMLLKGNDWSNGQTTDYVTTFWDGSFELKLTSPLQQPLFVDNGDEIEIDAETPVASDYELYINDVLIDTKSDVVNYSYTHTVTEVTGFATVKLKATEGTNTEEVTFQYIISAASPVEARPPGIIPGINYDPTNNTKVTLCLWAPGKTSAYVRGDFSDWQVLPENQMKRDGEYLWLEITGLTAGEEYAYQYLVDETLFLADPYADKILDPDDQYIPESSYPGLKAYPQAALNISWNQYFHRASVLQTGQTPYAWQVTDFQKPEKEKLNIYELLIRDFFGSNDRTYQNLIDTVGYFKRLGVNAIELMPIMEFNGNESWGYNPTFMFAPDKYYGPKNKLKEFIDKCHEEGIAVIFDIALNHQDAPNPYVLMDYDFDSYKVTPDNRWFNVEATHPYSVFYDMNHESPYTQAYVDTVTYYWLHEYHIDGYRFDLSKGFTQTNSGDNVSLWSDYDASRIAILERMADKIWSHTPDAYVILEHFADNTEEKALAEYRADEGKGMMLWGNSNYAYNQNTMGYGTDSDISWIYYGTRNWSVPHVVGYMESHDEERLMYKNLTFGNSSGSYNVKSLKTALKRMKAANLVFYTIPGPKMLWEFGEFGYDQSINRCEDGSIDGNCRVSPKPVKWDYLSSSDRLSLFNQTADLLRLRNTFHVFTSGEATLQGGNTLIKQVTVKHQPYTATPANANEMNIKAVANFELTTQNIPVEFPHTGTWYDYYAHGEPVNVGAMVLNVTLGPGEYKLYTDVLIDNLLVTGVSNEALASSQIKVFPNPVDDVLTVTSTGERIRSVAIYSLQGMIVTPVRIAEDQWDVHSLADGLYIVKVRTPEKTYWTKLIKR